MVKFPTADKDEGLGTGKIDFMLDAIVSTENKKVEFSGFGGITIRPDADEFDLSNGFRYGFGLGVPSRGPAAPHRGSDR